MNDVSLGMRESRVSIDKRELIISIIFAIVNCVGNENENVHIVKCVQFQIVSKSEKHLAILGLDYVHTKKN